MIEHTTVFTPRYVRQGKSLGHIAYEMYQLRVRPAALLAPWDVLPASMQQAWDDLATQVVETWGGPTMEEQPQRLPKRRTRRHVAR
jgi:hypothetical protein